MKKYILLLLMLFSAFSYGQQPYFGVLTITSQDQIDNFNYSSVSSSLIISETNPGDIKNLHGLYKLTSIRNLYIRGNKNLKNLEGLENIKGFYGYIIIKDNTNLESLDGLNSSEIYPDRVLITNNINLDRFCGIEKNWVYDFTVYGNKYNPAYFDEIPKDCSQLDGDLILKSQSDINRNRKYTKIKGDLIIEENLTGSITSLLNLENILSVVGKIKIINNSDLKNFCGIKHLIENKKDENVIITDNAYNPSKDEVINEGCTTYRGNVTLDDQNSVDNFPYKKVIGDLTIKPSTSTSIITNLNKLSTLENIEGSFYVENNDKLDNYCGIQHLVTTNNISGSFITKDNVYNPTAEELKNKCSVKVLYNNSSISHNIYTQDQLDQFYDNGYELIAGNLIIEGDTSHIENLSKLNKLIEITGSLYIRKNTNLKNLQGLNNLKKVYNLYIGGGEYGYDDGTGNPSLISLDGLDKLETIVGFLRVMNNKNLISIKGLSSLQRIDSDENRNAWRNSIIIQNNESLLNLKGLEKIQSVKNGISIKENPSLENLSGLNNISSSGFVSLIDNNKLINLEGLNKLKTINGPLSIGTTMNYSPEGVSFYDDSLLESLEGLESLTTLHGEFKIIGNSNLTSLKGLEKLEQVNKDERYTGLLRSINISNNQSLKNITSLSALKSIHGSMSISSNKSLESVSGIENITSIGGVLNITYNSNCLNLCSVSNIVSNNVIKDENLSIYENGYNPTYDDLKNNFCAVSGGFDGIDTYNGSLIFTQQSEIDTFNYSKITGNLVIEENEIGNITNLDKLISLTKVEGAITINNNIALKSLSGLENLETSYRFSSFNNSSLNSLSALSKMNTKVLTIENNDQLISLHGLGSVTNLKDLIIHRNEQLTSLDGLESLEFINSSIDISSNNALRDFKVLKGIHKKMNLASMIVRENNSLESLEGLNNVESVEGWLNIRENNKITSLQGLENLTSVYTFYIQKNANLKNLKGLEKLNTVKNYLVIGSSSYSSPIAYGNPELETLDGLDNLKEVNRIRIVHNPKLNSISALHNLGKAPYTNIEANNSLQSLDGIQNINQMNYLRVMYNQNLTDFCAVKPLLENEVIRSFWPSNNASNPRTSEILALDNCSLSNDISIFTNDEIDIEISSELININIEDINKIELYDMTGSLVKTNNIPFIDISNIQSGIYILSVERLNKTTSRTKIAITK
ncbi:T9SS type A sorting domain-containing protein [Wenyingzhuangia sp. IMCC45574]